MRDKILQQLRQAGHGLTFKELQQCDIAIDFWSIGEWLELLQDMENDKFVFLHRADGSANTVKGEIVLIVLREEEN